MLKRGGVGSMISELGSSNGVGRGTPYWIAVLLANYSCPKATHLCMGPYERAETSAGPTLHRKLNYVAP